MTNQPPTDHNSTRPHAPGLLALYQRGIRDGRIGHSAPPEPHRRSPANMTYFLGYRCGVLQAADEAT